MKLPVPKFLATKQAHIKFFDGTDENGAEEIQSEVDVSCRLQSYDGTTYTKDGQKVSLKAKVFVFEKLESFPEEVTGKCTVDCSDYNIATASRKLNPDGTVNHIVLELA